MRCFGVGDVGVMLAFVLMCNCQVGRALQRVTRPVVRDGRGAVLPQHVALRRRQRRRSRFVRRQVFVELLHEEKRKRVVNRPQGRDHAPRACQQERSRERRDSLLALKRADGRVASREDHEVGLQRQLNNLGSLKKTVFARGRIAQ